MATFILTAGDDSKTGTANADVFDGYAGDDGQGETGGHDMLAGGRGNDLFIFSSENSFVSGQVDGGRDYDTVKAYFFDLGSVSFVNVEALSIETYELGATFAQLNAFSTITSSILPATARYLIYGIGPAGAIDFSTRITDQRSIEFNGFSVSGGATVTGTANNDIFKPGYGDDVMKGGKGNDQFFARYGEGQSGGTDSFSGGEGADTFTLRRVSGLVDGGKGNDTVVAYQSLVPFTSPLGDLGDATFLNVETLISGKNITYALLEQLNAFSRITGGDDTKLIKFDLRSGAGGTIDFSTKLTLAGEHIWLRAFGATSAVDLTGSDGDDVLGGSKFDDRIEGGNGNDFLGGVEFSIGPMGEDTLIGGAGDDTYYVDPTDTSIETLAGGDGGIDTIISTADFDLNGPRVQGEFENLTLNGYLGDENAAKRGYGNALANVITGNGADNYLDGRGGADHLIGKAGNDTFIVDDFGDVVEELTFRNDGTDQVLSSIDFDLSDPNRAIGFIENLELTGTADLAGTGNALDNFLTGNSGANRLLGLDGNDKLDGAGGADTMQGGIGDDTYYVDNAADKVIEAAGGGTADQVLASADYRLAVGQHIESLLARDPAGTANIMLTGNERPQTMTGNNGHNRLYGDGGNDTLSGLGGIDTLDGQGGHDTLTGGTNLDKFVFRQVGLNAANSDLITDFSAQDEIWFDTATGTGAAINPSIFVNGTAALGAEDRFIYNQATGQLSFDADGTGAIGQILLATLGQTTHFALTAADIILF